MMFRMNLPFTDFYVFLLSGYAVVLSQGEIWLFQIHQEKPTVKGCGATRHSPQTVKIELLRKRSFLACFLECGGYDAPTTLQRRLTSLKIRKHQKPLRVPRKHTLGCSLCFSCVRLNALLLRFEAVSGVRLSLRSPIPHHLPGYKLCRLLMLLRNHCWF
jgi:hypothetical protein